jgi:hypothetical protein
MKVSDLIRQLQACDPQAIVVIPHVHGEAQGTEALLEVVPIAPAQLSGGPAAGRSVVRLCGFAAAAGLAVISAEESARA